MSSGRTEAPTVIPTFPLFPPPLATRNFGPDEGVLLGGTMPSSGPNPQLHGTVSSMGVAWQPIVPPTSAQQLNFPPSLPSFHHHHQYHHHHHHHHQQQYHSPPSFPSAIQLAHTCATTAAPGAWGVLPPPSQLCLPSFGSLDGHGGGGSSSDPSPSGMSMASLPSTGVFNHSLSVHGPVVVPGSGWGSEPPPFQAKPAPHMCVPQHPGIFFTTGPRVIGGRLRTGSNVHTALKDVCQYFSYHDALPARDAGCESPAAQVLPLFVQMYPHEHMENAQSLFDTVMCLICGPGAGRVVGLEQRSDTSFLVHVQTNVVWHILYNLRCRVLMDRHGFWYAGSIPQYVTMREYCDRLRNLPQNSRHTAADGMPSLPLVVELARSVQRRSISAPPAPASFDVQVPR